MLKLPSLGELDRGVGVRIYLCTSPADMRKGFDTLAALVREHLGHDPLSGHLFLFVGRGRDRLKIMYWDTDGYALWYKRLESESSHLIVFTEVEGRAHNQQVGAAEAGRLVGISRRSGSRRSAMPRHGSLSVPPRARRPGWLCRSTNSGRV